VAFVQGDADVEQDSYRTCGSLLFRVEDERHWEAEFAWSRTLDQPAVVKFKPRQQQGRMLGNTGGSGKNDPYIASLNLPGFASLSLQGYCASPTHNSFTMSSTCP